MAEREGFEPSIRTSRIPDFESGAFDHSAISPRGRANSIKRISIAQGLEWALANLTPIFQRYQTRQSSNMLSRHTLATVLGFIENREETRVIKTREESRLEIW